MVHASHLAVSRAAGCYRLCVEAGVPLDIFNERGVQRLELKGAFFWWCWLVQQGHCTDFGYGEQQSCERVGRSDRPVGSKLGS